jgi:hypothetical protein
MRRIAVLTVLLASSMTACGVFSDDSASATWVLAANQDGNATTSEFEVLVTRTGCNGDVTGDVLPPEVERHSAQVVLTFTVKPDEPSLAPCPGNAAVRYRVHLDEPQDEARLVDGYCMVTTQADHPRPGTSSTSVPIADCLSR